MTLVLTTDVGAADSTLELQTPGQGTVRFKTATLPAPDAPATVQSQLGWATIGGATGNLLTLQPAGHAAGLYVIMMSAVIRTLATNSVRNFTATVGFTAPNGVGALNLTGRLDSWSGSNGGSPAPVLASARLTAGATNIAVPSSPMLVVPSTGVTAITFQAINSFADTALLIDMYAAATRMAAFP